MTQKLRRELIPTRALLHTLYQVHVVRKNINIVYFGTLIVFIVALLFVPMFFDFQTQLGMRLFIAIFGISIFRLIAIWHSDYIRRFDSSHNVIYENFEAFPASFFLDLLQSDSDNEAELAQKCLIKLLPKLTEEDAPSFTTGYRSRLYALLTYSNVDLVLAVLQSLPLLGDREAIIFVRSLSQGKWSAEKSVAVRKAAQQCLTELPDHFARRAKQQHLLRPSMRSVAPDILLRPADGINPDAPEETDQLLHPVLSHDAVVNTETAGH